MPPTEKTDAETEKTRTNRVRVRWR